MHALKIKTKDWKEIAPHGEIDAVVKFCMGYM